MGAFFSDPIGNLVGLVTLVGAVMAGWRWGLPRARRRAQRQRDMEVAILGRPAIPENRNTGEPAQEELRPLRELVSEVHHEVFPNSGKSLRDDVVAIRSRLGEGEAHFGAHDAQFAEIRADIEQIKRLVGVELRTATEAVGNAAEAAKTLLPVIDTAIKATPPRDDVADLD